MNRLVIGPVTGQRGEDEVLVREDGTVKITNEELGTLVYTKEQWAALCAFVQQEQYAAQLRELPVPRALNNPF